MSKAASDWFAATRAGSQVHDSFTAVLGINSADFKVDKPNSVLICSVMVTCDCSLVTCVAVLGRCHSGEGRVSLKLSANLAEAKVPISGKKGNRRWKYSDEIGFLGFSG